jgi:hypothetical protein
VNAQQQVAALNAQEQMKAQQQQVAATWNAPNSSQISQSKGTAAAAAGGGANKVKTKRKIPNIPPKPSKYS